MATRQELLDNLSQHKAQLQQVSIQSTVKSLVYDHWGNCFISKNLGGVLYCGLFLHFYFSHSMYVDVHFVVFCVSIFDPQELIICDLLYYYNIR